jgi:hypothetical protein|tara:strand:+ start:41 stop:949 length:909 start_codon:yes stop_codon:yes gene_type:complete
MPRANTNKGNHMNMQQNNIGHNLNAVLADVVNGITKEHNSLMALVETSEAKAKRIGQLLNYIKPTLKELKVSMVDFVKEELPFSRSTAYEYMSIADGKTTLAEQNIRKKESAQADKLEHWTEHKDLLNLLLFQERARRKVEEAREINDLSAYETANNTALSIEEELGASRTQLKAFWDACGSPKINKLFCAIWIGVTKTDKFTQEVTDVLLDLTVQQPLELCGGDWKTLCFASEMKFGEIVHAEGWKTEERQGFLWLEAMEADIKELCDKHGEDVVYKVLLGGLEMNNSNINKGNHMNKLHK